MLRMASAGLTALLVTASSLALAEDSSKPEGRIMERLSAGDLSALTDARIDIIKTTLELTPDQQKYWQPVENAIRARAKNRQSRLEALEKRIDEMTSDNLPESVANRDPIVFMNRRADALAQRATDLKNLADAWQPLYQNLTPQQKKRMSFLTLIVIRELRNALEDRRMQEDEADED